MEKSTFEKKLTCADCKFSDKHVREDHNIVTICRWDPPVVAYAFMPTGPGQGAIAAQSLWPEMRLGDWCAKLETRSN